MGKKIVAKAAVIGGHALVGWALCAATMGIGMQLFPTLNVANLSAYYVSTAVSTAWLPGIKNAARYTFSNATEQIGLSFPTNLVQEFWPEFRRHVLRQH